MTLTLEEARRSSPPVERTGLLFGLTHNYTGYPMVKEARDMIAAGQPRTGPEGRRRVSRRAGSRPA